MGNTKDILKEIQDDVKRVLKEKHLVTADQPSEKEWVKKPQEWVSDNLVHDLSVSPGLGWVSYKITKGYPGTCGHMWGHSGLMARAQTLSGVLDFHYLSLTKSPNFFESSFSIEKWSIYRKSQPTERNHRTQARPASTNSHVNERGGLGDALGLGLSSQGGALQPQLFWAPTTPSRPILMGGWLKVPHQGVYCKNRLHIKEKH